jgi:hypothetical protein
VISVNLFLFLAEEPVLAQIFGALAPKVLWQILQDQRRQKTGPSFTETNNERN